MTVGFEAVAVGVELEIAGFVMKRSEAAEKNGEEAVALNAADEREYGQLMPMREL